MEITKRGTFKIEVGKIEINDHAVTGAITTALTDKGFDLVLKPGANDRQRVVIIYKEV